MAKYLKRFAKVMWWVLFRPNDRIAFKTPKNFLTSKLTSSCAPKNYKFCLLFSKYWKKVMIEKMLWWKKCYFETLLLSHDQIRPGQGRKLFIKLIKLKLLKIELILNWKFNKLFKLKILKLNFLNSKNSISILFNLIQLDWIFWIQN